MKKFPAVYAWNEEYNNDASAGWNKDLVILEKGEPIPTIKKYNVQNKNCNLTGDSGATGTFAMEDEDEDSTIVLASGSAIKDADDKDEITAAIEAAIANAKSRRRLEDEEL